MSGKVRDVFSSGEVARLTGVPIRTLQRWGKDGFLTPSGRWGNTGYMLGHRWTFRDVVAIRVAVQIRTHMGTNLQVLRRIQEQLLSWQGVDLAGAALVIAGSDVYSCEGDKLMSLLRQPGQLTAPQVVFLEDLEKEVREKIRELAA